MRVEEPIWHSRRTVMEHSANVSLPHSLRCWRAAAIARFISSPFTCAPRTYPARLLQTVIILARRFTTTLAGLFSKASTVLRDFLDGRPRPLGRLCARRISARTGGTGVFGRGPIRPQQHRRQSRVARQPATCSQSSEASRCLRGATLRTGDSRMDRRVNGGVLGRAAHCLSPTTPLLCECSISIASRHFICHGLGDTLDPCAGTLFSENFKEPSFRPHPFSTARRSVSSRLPTLSLVLHAPLKWGAKGGRSRWTASF